MKKIVLASNNKHKITEISQILNNQEIITMEQIGFDKEIIEDGTTFLENALIKAKTISEFIKDKGLDYDVLSDDSGLCCEALDGKPGIYSARYSENHNDKANRDKLIKDLEGKDKTAYFNCTMVLYHIDGTYEHVDGKTYGKIIDHEVGDTSFGYDCIFLSKDLNKTLYIGTEDDSMVNFVSSDDLNEVKLEENKTNNPQTKAQNEPQTDEKRTPIKGKSSDISTYSSKRQIYSDAFKRFANLQNLDNTAITTLLNSIDKSNIKV